MYKIEKNVYIHAGPALANRRLCSTLPISFPPPLPFPPYPSPPFPFPSPQLCFPLSRPRCDRSIWQVNLHGLLRPPPKFAAMFGRTLNMPKAGPVYTSYFTKPDPKNAYRVKSIIRVKQNKNVCESALKYLLKFRI